MKATSPVSKNIAPRSARSPRPILQKKKGGRKARNRWILKVTQTYRISQKHPQLASTFPVVISVSIATDRSEITKRQADPLWPVSTKSVDFRYGRIETSYPVFISLSPLWPEANRGCNEASSTVPRFNFPSRVLCRSRGTARTFTCGQQSRRGTPLTSPESSRCSLYK